MSRDDKYSRLEYRRLIAWPKRLEREAALLLEVFESADLRRVLDLGCGTGEHARFLVSHGFEVVGVDRSEAMIAAARDEPLPPGLEFIHGDIRQVDTLAAGAFGGVLCVGNTLPHLRRQEDLDRLFSGVRRLLAAGGRFLLQILNYQRILQQGIRALPVSVRPDAEGEIVFLRLMKPTADGEILFFPCTLDLRPGAEPPVTLQRAKEVRLRAWLPEEILGALERCDLPVREVLGAFDRSPFAVEASADLIVVAG